MRLKRKKTDAGRNIRPSGSANVFSYYASRSRTDNNTGRGENSGEKKHISLLPGRRVRLLVSSLVIVFGVAYLLWIGSTPNIEIVGQPQAGSLLQATSTYQKASKELLNESVMNRFKLTINTSTIERKLKDQFPEIAEVAITMPVTSQRLLFKIQPVTPSLVLTSRNHGSYVIDERGIAVVNASDVPSLNQLKLPLVSDESGLDINVGKPVLPGESIIFISNTLAQLKAQDIEVTSMSLPTVANELHLRLVGEGYLVKYNMAGDSRLQTGAFLAVRKKLIAENKKPAEYIDVRVTDKVFYK